jgi:hypothetical protein
MGKVSPKVRKFRKRAKPGSIMSAKTFSTIARRAGGGAKGARIAGKAYWQAAKRRAAGKKKTTK